MECSAEVNDAVEASTGTHHFKRIHMDQAPPQQSGDRESIETPAPAMSREMDWHDHFPLMQMHDTPLNGIGGKSASNIDSHPGSELRSQGPQSSSDPGVMVEELTLKNFKSPVMSLVGNSTNGEKLPFGTGFWRNFSRIACGADKTSSCSISDGFQDNVCNSSVSYGTTRSMLDTTKVCEHRGNFMGSTNVTIKSPDELQNKTPPASGFQQFFAKNKSKGKEVVASRQYSNIHDIPGDLVHNRSTLRLDSNLEKIPNSSPKPNAKEKGTCLLGGGSGSTKFSPSSNEGMSLREWLKPKRQKINKVERMHIFKQILDLVHICHSQGIALMNLRPSYFVILPINQVKYIGSFSSQGQMVQQPRSREQDSHSSVHHFKRNRYLGKDQEAQDISMSKHQRIRGPNGIRFGHFGYPLQSGHQMDSEADRNEVDHSKTRQFTYDSRKRNLTGHHQPFDKSHSPSFSSVGTQYFMLEELMKLEDSWYATPEELHDNTSQFSSNIYNLGVLLFELYCCFETWESHCAAMLDLRLRILPPNFLSESPKEAGFCLWLLHPDPAGRPTSRDILSSDLINENRDFSSLDHSSALIEEEDTEADLLLHFIVCLKEQKEQQLAKLVAGLGCLNTDIEEIEKRHFLRSERFVGSKCLRSNINVSVLDSHEKPAVPESSLSTSHTYEERLVKNIDQLESAYFSMRSKIEISVANTVTRRDNDVLKIRDKYCQIQTDVGENEARDSFGTFFEGLCKYARYSKFEVRGSLKNVDILNSANVICSLSFDRDEEYFAAAGVSKKIKIFEFDALVNDNVDIHYPLIEMSSKSKLSCVCWNNYIKNYLASTDYDGVVQLWDASTAQGFTQFTEHQRRAWSVNFSQVDPIKLASGSDDCYLKLWSINEKNSIDTIKNVANVCCVQFSSYSSHMLAFGSADYKIYCYDLRNTRIPWCTLAGHGKAVSYVKFLESGTLISASTDNTLKLWDLNRTSVSGLSNSACSLTLTGHTNEKNFVGLSVCDGYITCGSETNEETTNSRKLINPRVYSKQSYRVVLKCAWNNFVGLKLPILVLHEVYAYYKTFPMPITSHKFGSIDPITAQETNDDNGQFVSSVCWRGKSNMVVAANSTGSIKVLQLV